MNASEKTVPATKSSVVWEGECNLKMWRLVSDGQCIVLEIAGPLDAMGTRGWNRRDFSELPTAARKYLAGAVITAPGHGAKTIFSPELCKHTPSVVRELAGQSVELAARIMSITLREQEQGMNALATCLKGCGDRKPEEGVFEAAVRTMSSLATQNVFMKNEINELKQGAETLSNLIADIEVGLILREAMPVFKPLRSLNERARTMIEYLSRVLVKTTIATETVTTTVAHQEPVLPHC